MSAAGSLEPLAAEGLCGEKRALGPMVKGKAARLP